MDQNTLHYCYDEHMATNQQTKINKTCCHNIASLSCHNFQRLVKIYYLSLDFLKTRQSALIRKIKLLTFNFITTTLLDVLDKNRYQQNTYLLYLSIDHLVRLSWKMLTYDKLANSRLSQQNSSSKLFWLKNLWVDNIQSPAYHKKLAKPTKNNQPIVIKRFNLKF